MIDSQKEILKHFLAGGSLTVLRAIEMYHTTELRKVVCRLKKLGYNIVSKKVPGKTHHEYELVSGTIDCNAGVHTCQ